jgi:hypothetical protein
MGADLPSAGPLVVISASRRTDLARCHPEVLAAWLAAGRVTVRNPFNGLAREVDLRPEAVHTLVLWSKDYSALLADAHGLRGLLARYTQVVCHFTVTGLGGGPLEPGVLPPADAARQFPELVGLGGSPERVRWRFDPIVFWRTGKGVEGNLRAFDALATAAAAAGLRRVTVSLYQDYAKARRRAVRIGLAFVRPHPDRVRAVARWLQGRALAHGLSVRACASPELEAAGIQPGKCIDGEELMRLHPARATAPAGKDPGQRPACGCTPSVDIGDYHLSCPDGCVYCYANPK